MLELRGRPAKKSAEYLGDCVVFPIFAISPMGHSAANQSIQTRLPMKKPILFAMLFGMLLGLGSCVSKKEFTKLQGEYSSLQSRYHQSQVDLASSVAKGKSLEDRLADAQRENAELKRQYAALQGSLDKSLLQNNQGSINISKLVDEINASNKYIKQLVEAKSKSDSLNLVLTNNLTRSLSRDELQEVDIKVLKGVVYVSLADNMLYKSGS